MTDEQLLAEVNAAISAIATKGKRYAIAGRQYERADLENLRKFRGELEARIGRKAEGGLKMRFGVAQ